jgi:beta-1,4-mannosyltransferase
MQAAVIVLGDLGRSPRMQYHACALAASGVAVDLIGETGTPLLSHVRHPHIHEHRLPPRRGISGVAGSALGLLVALCRITRPDVIVVQTPPAIPTILVAWIVARVRGSRLVLDWHNLGWTMLIARFRRTHPLVRVARQLERLSARLADTHLTVSDALAQHLQRTWGLTAVQVVRDRPADVFDARHRAESMRAQLRQLAGLPTNARPAIVISPTSWTRDEATDLIFTAADTLEQTWRDRGPADGLLIVVSGIGAGRAAFEQRLRARTGQRVHIVATWVSGEDYPVLLASADAGLSLHRSSSGLDLPMKISDMFGASLPVCALDYGSTLRELITPDENAVVFADGHELAACLDRLFRTWPTPTMLWQQLHLGAAAVADGPRWTAGWQREAFDVLVPPEGRQ